MTPAVTELEAAGVEFVTLSYDHDPGGSDGYGLEAAAKTGIDPDQVFKTLLVTFVDGADRPQLAVAIVPVSSKLGLKQVGRALGVKRVEMCDPGLAERTTGYVRGGISPFGQRKRLPTVIDELAFAFDRVFVSGGQRGVEVGLAPQDLVDLLDATVAAIAV